MTKATLNTRLNHGYTQVQALENLVQTKSYLGLNQDLFNLGSVSHSTKPFV